MPPTMLYEAVEKAFKKKKDQISRADPIERILITNMTRHGVLGLPHYDKYYVVVVPLENGGSELNIKLCSYWVDFERQELKPEENREVVKRRREAFVKAVEAALEE